MIELLLWLVLFWFGSGLLFWFIKIFIYFRGPNNYFEWLFKIEPPTNGLTIIEVKNHLLLCTFMSLVSVIFGPVNLLDIFYMKKKINDIINRSDEVQ